MVEKHRLMGKLKRKINLYMSILQLSLCDGHVLAGMQTICFHFCRKREEGLQTCPYGTGWGIAKEQNCKTQSSPESEQDSICLAVYI